MARKCAGQVFANSRVGHGAIALVLPRAGWKRTLHGTAGLDSRPIQGSSQGLASVFGVRQPGANVMLPMRRGCRTALSAPGANCDDARMAYEPGSSGGCGRSLPTHVVAVCMVLLAAACSSSGDDPASETRSPSPTTTTTTTTTTAFTSVEWPTDGWPATTPEKQGMESTALADLVDWMAGHGGFDSITIIRNGHVVLDTTIYPFPDDTGHGLYSVTKSVTGTLIGIAIDRGLLAGVDVRVVDVLAQAAPQTVDESLAAMTVEDLLTMRSGLECHDQGARILPEIIIHEDWATQVLRLPILVEPGTRFHYCNWDSYLLSAVVTEVTGMPAAAFADEALFGPLGIREYTWPTNADGVTIGFADLVLEPADAAKLGYLYLRDGVWDGQQVVSSTWVAAATRSHTTTHGSAGYGYQWWIDGGGSGASARGHGGQRISIVPDLDLVVVLTAYLEPRQRTSLPDQLMQRVLLAVRPDPLDPDPEGNARLAAAVDAARRGPPSSPVTMPELADAIDGVRYEFRANEFQNEWFALTFEDQRAHLTIEGGTLGPLEPYLETFRGVVTRDGPVEYEIGLDGRFTVGESWGQPTGWRGRWHGDDRFVAEFKMLERANVRGSLEFTFEDGMVHLRFRDSMGDLDQTSTADRVD